MGNIQSWKELRRAIKYPLLEYLIKLAVLIFKHIPRGILLSGSAWLGRQAFWLVKNERDKTISNLAIAFGDNKTTEEITLMARRVFVHQALNFADYVHTLDYTTREQFAELVDVVGEEHLRRAYEGGKGVICLMAHIGSWEFSAIMPPVLGYETSAVSRSMPNPRIDKIIVSYRQKRGMKNIPRGNAYQRLIDALKSGECLVIMIDQDTRTKGVFVDFMGKPAYTPVGAARLALDSGAPVVPMFFKRKDCNRHQFSIFPEVPLIQTGNLESDLIENTKVYNSIIEREVKENPEQWVWMHERWKTTSADIEAYMKQKQGI